MALTLRTQLEGEEMTAELAPSMVAEIRRPEQTREGLGVTSTGLLQRASNSPTRRTLNNQTLQIWTAQERTLGWRLTLLPCSPPVLNSWLGPLSYHIFLSFSGLVLVF